MKHSFKIYLHSKKENDSKIKVNVLMGYRRDILTQAAISLQCLESKRQNRMPCPLVGEAKIRLVFHQRCLEKYSDQTER